MNLLKTASRAAALTLALVSSNAQAHETVAGDLTIIHAQARPNLPNRPTAAYMVIANDGETTDRLIGARSDHFGTIEMHTTLKQGDVMKMTPVEGIEVPSGDAAVLEPGGLHLMLFEGNERFKVGDEFPLTLVFEKAGEVVVTIKVEKISGAGHGSDGDHGDHGDHGVKHDGNGTHGTVSE